MSAMLMGVVLLVSLSHDVSHSSGLSEPGLCHLETCSIGFEYCDEIEERCSPCTETVCQLSSIPPACQQKCKALKEDNSKGQEERCDCSKVADQNYTSSPSKHRPTPLTSPDSSELLVWRAVAGIALALLIMVILAITFIHKLPIGFRQWISRKILRVKTSNDRSRAEVTPFIPEPAGA